MARPQLPADFQNPWGQILRDAINQVSDTADDGVNASTTNTADIADLQAGQDLNDSTIASHGTRLTTAETTLATKANDSATVHKTGSETISGVKTFNTAPVVPDGAFAISKVSGLQTQLNGKAPITSPTFTGTVSGITKDMVGLPNAQNTTDLDKPISTATQAALDLKASISQLNSGIQTHNHTGGASGVNIPVAAVTGLQTDLNSKETGWAEATYGLGYFDYDNAMWSNDYFAMHRFGRLAYIILSIQSKERIDASRDGDIINTLIGTIRTGNPIGDNMFTGMNNDYYDGYRYPLTTVSGGPVAAGVVVSTNRLVYLTALSTREDDYFVGQRFTLGGWIMLTKAD